MSKSILSSLSIAAIAGGAMLALELSPASAFTLYGASARPLDFGQFDRVYYRGGYRGGVRYHGAYRGGYAYRGRYGYHGGYGYRYGYRGGYGYRYGYHCWINSYGTRVCSY